MAARRPRDGAEAVAAASDENANPCKKARIDDDLLRRTMATIGAPPEAPPDPSAEQNRFYEQLCTDSNYWCARSLRDVLTGE